MAQLEVTMWPNQRPPHGTLSLVKIICIGEMWSAGVKLATSDVQIGHPTTKPQVEIVYGNSEFQYIVYSQCIWG